MNTRCIVPPSDYRDEIGVMFLHLAACGESDGLTWDLLDQALRRRIEDAEWRAVGFIGGILDQMIEGGHCGP